MISSKIEITNFEKITLVHGNKAKTICNFKKFDLHCNKAKLKKFESSICTAIRPSSKISNFSIPDYLKSLCLQNFEPGLNWLIHINNSANSCISKIHN